MAGAKPQLITFGISHYCEKACWALDWHGIDYDEIRWPLGVHIFLAKRIGAKHSAVPILLDGSHIIQGSGAIIDWADEHAPDFSKRLTLPDALEIEQRADDGIGIHIRQIFYALILPKASHVAKQALFANTSPMHRFIGNVMWPVTRRVMRRKFDLGPSGVQESSAKLGAELDWLDNLLSDGRQYLAGDCFSRADVTVASLLAPLARPKQMKIYHDMDVPEAFTATVECWTDRPVIRWTLERYQANRE